MSLKHILLAANYGQLDFKALRKYYIIYLSFSHTDDVIELWMWIILVQLYIAVASLWIIMT